MTKAKKGFLIAPIVPGLVFVVFAAIMGVVTGVISSLSHKNWIELITIPFIVIIGSPIWFVYVLPVSYFLSLLFGIPMYLIFNKIGILDLKSYIIGSLFAGIVSGLIEELYLFQYKTLSWHSFWIIGAAGFFGAITGFSFWTIVYGNPNNIFDRFLNRWKEEFPRG